ncbi:MAG: amidohydrolase/deacetylase family metallohydrolase [Vicinamibacterales bacterium]|jgi:dihydroorotase|nr:amidohydrolase/deacetylase family metallohydrolase [Acidobacteriota bacterium]MDP7472616.1 amidohydrolase/deacetylase family metallohydrolase [Vicinamibacterales bacterium]MDP7672665.1 amidohydrolase/deacetylase family metallohydrolase [Vicinamibacterales bacterium]HJO38490.1 amidohydrolase/deacetylase family metallohydrolase [Vicinamibacterales bacterium]
MRARFAAIPVFVLLAGATGAYAQSLDLLIQGGRVIDPRNGIDAVMDVGIADGVIAEVAAGIDPARAETVVDATGLVVAPGLIDLHAHVFWGTQPDQAYSDGYSAVQPDGFTFRSGVTTVIDLGDAGWRDFVQFKEQVIDRSQTRVLAFLNIVGRGMKGGPIEQDVSDMDPKLTAQRAAQFSDIIVGVKVAHYIGNEWEPVDRAVEAGNLAGIPVAVDFGRQEPDLPLQELFLDHLRPGDIFTHAYAQVGGREAIVDDEGRLKPYLADARARGIVFDVGHGGGSFRFSQAVPAMQQAFPPDTISTDLHIGSMNGGMKDMLNVGSKFLNIGMSLPDVVAKSTWAAAQAIHRDDIGHLSVGAEADVAVIAVREGEFGFLDVGGQTMQGSRKLEAELTVRAGRIVWDLNGRAGTPWTP